MITSRASFLSDVVSGGVVPPGKLAYFRQRFRNKLHAAVLGEFAQRERSGRLTKKQLAERIGKRPEQITRWLTAPGNWTLDTVSDLLVGMGAEPKVTVGQLVESPASDALVTRDVILRTAQGVFSRWVTIVHTTVWTRRTIPASELGVPGGMLLPEQEAVTQPLMH